MSAPVRGESLAVHHGPTAIEFLVRENNRYMESLARAQAIIRDIEEWFDTRGNENLNQKEFEHMKENRRWAQCLK